MSVDRYNKPTVIMDFNTIFSVTKVIRLNL